MSFYAPSGMDADWLLPVDGERFIAVGAPANGGVAELDEAGNVVWSSTPLPGGFLKTGAKTQDGGLMVAGQVIDSTSPSGEGLWLGRLDGAGQLLESRQLGPSTFSVHVDIELLPHPTGGYVLSTHDSEAEGAAPRLRLVRLDDAGEIVHERFMPLAPGSAMPESWSRGGAALLPGGDVVQLTAHAGYLRVVRSTEQTAPVFDRVLEEVGGAWPQDIAALPDGRIAIAAISVGQSHVILLDADGTVIWARTYHPELDTELNAIAHDPSTGLLHLGGATRGADGGTLRTWLISVDTDGELRWEYEGDVGTPARINGVTLLPGGGFVATGFGDFVYAVVRPKACP
ncbi:hypothetical protein [Sorangium atrum]|uniref:Uncharacterized protein n=1 Tax=Sorangium atrum TaxID=2995308 RepID=A0ABT5BZU0_9BACT|nr:hypothetical protein [Sorangium aterium]MDC0679034.1 hypothetical protein [Sorangium aterium]